MPRYIDADALLQELQEEIECDTPMYTEEQNQYVNRGLKIAIKDIKHMSTADVAPKSEVASEIFDEISKLCTLHGDSWNPSRIVAHIYFDWLLELKDKYTKGGEG